MSAKVKACVRQGEGVAGTLHNVVDFLTKNNKIWTLIPDRGHVLGQGYSGYVSNKGQQAFSVPEEHCIEILPLKKANAEVPILH